MLYKNKQKKMRNFSTSGRTVSAYYSFSKGTAQQMLGYGSDFPYFTVTDVLTANPRSHYENMPMQYTATFNAVKVENFQLKIVDMF